MTTTSSALGYKFSYDYVTDGWYSYINNGEYTSEQESALVEALTNAQVDEFEKLLPESHYWMIHTSELQYPVGDDSEIGDLDALLGQASEAVCERFEKIETETLAELD